MDKIIRMSYDPVKKFPWECCLMVCKGACEKAFEKDRASMLFGPGLPDAICEIKFFDDDKKYP